MRQRRSEWHLAFFFMQHLHSYDCSITGLMSVGSHVAPLYQVGHKEGDQFTFHWWDHVFNKASSSLQVESDQVSSQSWTHPTPSSAKQHETGPLWCKGCDLTFSFVSKRSFLFLFCGNWMPFFRMRKQSCVIFSSQTFAKVTSWCTRSDSRHSACECSWMSSSFVAKGSIYKKKLRSELKLPLPFDSSAADCTDLFLLSC